MKNKNLHSAKANKKDEFYTQYEDIEKEINAYLEYDKDVFKGKTVFLPCDDPEWSNFTKYFLDNFHTLGLKKLISTSYNPEGKGKILETTTGENKWKYIKGNGDFRSEEITKLCDEADFIVTNPPFSLFREFLAWIMKGKKKFLIIGNMNAITYKETFPLIKENKIWLGASGVGATYQLPDSAEHFHKEEDGKKYANVSTACWFTNIYHGRRHEPLQLMTMEDNLKFNKAIKENGYQKYDNYDAIEIPRVNAIPSDYTGVIGVPISFLSKYNPDQFEVIAITNKGTVPSHLLIEGCDKYDRPYIDGRRMYSRILIRHKKAKNK